MTVYHIDQPTDVGPLIRHLRKQQRLTLHDLAAAVGTHIVSNLSALELGRRTPQLPLLLPLLSELGYRVLVVPVAMTAEQIEALTAQTFEEPQP